jgi:hypothetical protein
MFIIIISNQFMKDIHQTQTQDKNNLLWRDGQRWATICHPLPTHFFFQGAEKLKIL